MSRRRWLFWLLLDLVALAALIWIDRSLGANRPTSGEGASPTPTPSADHYAQQAEAAYRAGDLRRAEEGYRLALSLEPENPARYPPLIRLLAFSNRLEEAATWMERARRLAPEDPMVLGMATLILDWQGRIPEAIQAGSRPSPGHRSPALSTPIWRKPMRTPIVRRPPWRPLRKP